MKSAETTDKIAENSNEDGGFYFNPAPEEIVTEMFEKTDDDGILIWRRLIYDKNDEPCIYRCKMNWDFQDYENVKKAYTKLHDQLVAIGNFVLSTDDHPEGAYGYFGNPDFAQKIMDSIGDSELKDIITTYLIEDDIGGYDLEAKFNVWVISEGLNDEKDLKVMFTDYVNGKKLSKEDVDFIKEKLDEIPSDDDRKMYTEYWKLFDEDSKKRVGDSPFASDFIEAARWLYKFVTLRVPKKSIKDRAIDLAQMMVLHKHCESCEIVAEKVLEIAEERSKMSDEELDECSRPLKSNSRKNMASLFVFQVLSEHSSPLKPMTQKEIIKKLEEPPFEIKIERKALSRIIHNLCDSQVGIYSERGIGTWYSALK